MATDGDEIESTRRTKASEVDEEDENSEAEREFFPSSKMTNDESCPGFESQTWRKDRCKKCFRLKEQHLGGDGSKVGGGSKYAGAGSGNVASRVNKFSTDKESGSRRSSDNEFANTNSETDWRRRVYGESSNGKTAKLSATSVDELPSSSSASTMAAQEDSSTAKRKTKLLLIKAEVSFDGRPSEPVDVETTPTANEPNPVIRTSSVSPAPVRIVAASSRRPTSPLDISVR